MKRRWHLVQDLSGGIHTSKDPIFLADSESPSCKNVRLYKGMVSTARLPLQFGNQLNERILWIDTFYLSSGSDHLIVVTPTKIYKYNSQTGQFIQIYSGFTGNDDTIVCGTQGILADGTEVYIVTNGKDSMVKWSGSGDFTQMNFTYPLTGQYIGWYKSRLIIGSTYESGSYNKRRVFWSAIGNPEETRITYGAGFVDIHDTADWVTGIIPFRKTCLIFKERSIWELTYIGGTRVFELTLLIDGIGTSAPNSIVNVGEFLMFLGSDGIYLYNGVTLTNISSKIQTHLFLTGERVISGEHINKAHGIYVEELEEYWLAIPENDSVPRKIFRYNFPYDSWHVFELEATAFGYHTTPPDVSWNDFTTERWIDVTRQWSYTKLASLSPTTLIGTQNGTIYEDNQLGDPAYSSEFVTKDFVFGPSFRLRELRVDKKGGPVYVYFSRDQGKTWEGSFVLNETSDFFEHKLTFNETFKHVRFKFQTQNSKSMTIRLIAPVFIERVRTIEGDRWPGN